MFVYSFFTINHPHRYIRARTLIKYVQLIPRYNTTYCYILIVNTNIMKASRHKIIIISECCILYHCCFNIWNTVFVIYVKSGSVVILVGKETFLPLYIFHIFLPFLLFQLLTHSESVVNDHRPASLYLTVPSSLPTTRGLKIIKDYYYLQTDCFIKTNYRQHQLLRSLSIYSFTCLKCATGVKPFKLYAVLSS